MSLVRIGRIVMDGKDDIQIFFPCSEPIRQFGTRKRKQRPHKAVLGLSGNPGQASGAATLEHAEKDGLHLIVRMMRGYQVPGARFLLQTKQGPIPRFPGLRLGRAHSQREPDPVAREPVPRGEADNPLRHRGALAPNPVIDVRHGERYPQRGGDIAQEIQERHGIRSPAHCQEGEPGLREQSLVCDVP